MDVISYADLRAAVRDDNLVSTLDNADDYIQVMLSQLAQPDAWKCALFRDPDFHNIHSTISNCSISSAEGN